MKILTNIARVLVGCLFIFSGIIKNNDPKGTGIKLNEYFDVFAAATQVKQDSLYITINDNLGNKESLVSVLTTFDSVTNLECNQSAVGKTYELNTTDSSNSRDSVLSSDFFVVYQGNSIFNKKYTFNGKYNTINVLVLAGKDSILFKKSFALNANTKFESNTSLPVFKFVKKESMWVGFFRGLRPYSVLFAIIMCVLEVTLGFAVLIGWKPKLTIGLTIILIVFFSFLTFYSAYYNKVTDCGCFGDFIKLKPWTSFGKDIILLVLLLFLYYRRNYIVPFFSKLFSWNAVTLVTLGLTAFAVYCNSYLPVWDFLPYEVGNNIKTMMTAPAGQRQNDSIQMVFVYEKGGVKKDFMLSALPKSEDGWKYLDRKDSIIIKGWKSKIHDFDFSKREDSDIKIKDSLLNGSGYQLLIISGFVEKGYEDAWAEIKTLATDAKAKGIQVYGATSSSLADADVFAVQQQLPFKFNTADNVLLKTMARSNPMVMLWKDATILGKWSCRSIPDIKKIEKLMSK